MKHLPFAIAAWLLPLTLAAHAAENVEDSWCVIRFQDRHAGWMHNLVTRSGDRITTHSQVQLSIARGAASIDIGMESTFVETLGGKAVKARLSQQFATQKIEKHITFADDAVRVTTKQFGRSIEETHPPATGDWLPPAAAQRFATAQVKAGRRVFSYRTLDPSTSLTPFEVTVETLGPKDVEVYGRVVPAIERAVTMSILPSVRSLEYSDEHGRMLRSTMELGGIRMEMLAADKQLAMAKADPPELLLSTLVKGDFALLRPRKLRRQAYELAVERGTMPVLPESPVQRIERLDDKRVVVRIDLDTPRLLPPGAEPTVRHTPMINGGDEEVAKITKQALAKSPVGSTTKKAEALRRYAHGYMRRATLGVGMASASEVARTRTGDCTEYAVLLAAMLKAADIPARMASGLIYVHAFEGAENVFGYHAWAQAWLGGRWVDLDATLGPETPFDAAHILLSVSDLASDEMVNELVALSSLTGNLKIRPAPQ